MEKEILRTIKKLEEMGWITISSHLNTDAFAAVFVDIFKEMTLKNFIEIFSPKD